MGAYTELFMNIFYHILNVLLWAFFVVTSMILYIGALVIWAATYFFDPNRKILQKYTCFWSSLYIWANPFWSVKVSGKQNVERKKVYVMVSNHQSIMDILVLFKTFLHFKWVSKSSMFKAPLLGWNMKLNGYISIHRGDPSSRERCMATCRRWIEKGSSIVFFPEGTRSKDGKISRFKLGAFRLALETGADILPLVIRGSDKAVPKHSAMLTNKTKMSIEVLPSVSVRGFDKSRIDAEAERLADQVRDLIKRALGQDAEINHELDFSLSSAQLN